MVFDHSRDPRVIEWIGWLRTHHFGWSARFYVGEGPLSIASEFPDG
jgi:hypothetical protein